MTNPPRPIDELVSAGKQHREFVRAGDGVATGQCAHCQKTWPCFVSELTAALEAAKGDVARLDWLADNLMRIRLDHHKDEFMVIVYNGRTWDSHFADTFRGACDAARTQDES